MHLRRRLEALAPLLFLPLGAASVSAQTLDVNPGLWEVTIEQPRTVQQICYTREFLRSGLSQLHAPAGMKCTNQVRQATARIVVTHTVCTGSVSIEGETRLDILGPEAMAMQSNSIVNIGGKKQSISTSATYKWLRSDCGSVKPFDPRNPGG